MALLISRRKVESDRGTPPAHGAVLAAVFAVLAAIAASTAAAAENVEYAVKANYLYKLGPFIAWPPRAFPSSGSPFNVCVFGDDPFGSALDEAVRGQTVNGHPVVVRRVRAAPTDGRCQVLYVGRSHGEAPAEVLRMLQGQPVLTVTDGDQGVVGGMVHFLLQNGRVRFALNVAAAEASGLQISSKLQSLAVSVQRGG